MINWNDCKAAARRAEAVSFRDGGTNENKPIEYLGISASWEERRVFDFTYVAASAARRGDTVTEAAALEGADRIIRSAAKVR